jgi:hypothetical protein
MADWAGDERFELLDRLVGHPPSPDAQGFADAFADPVGPRAPLIGLLGCSYVVSSCSVSAVAAVSFLVLARWSKTGPSASTRCAHRDAGPDYESQPNPGER